MVLLRGDRFKFRRRVEKTVMARICTDWRKVAWVKPRWTTTSPENPPDRGSCGFPAASALCFHVRCLSPRADLVNAVSVAHPASGGSLGR